MADKVWARDRATGEIHEYEASFLDAWPSDYFRVPPPDGDAKATKKPPVRAASLVPAEGTHLEGGA